MTKPKFLLVDGSSYIYRAFYALPPLTNKDGMPTGALYGLIKMLKNLVIEQKPEKMCIALDPAGKTSRSNIYEPYKANRSAMPEELRSQMHYVIPLLEALGFTIKVIPGEEADDVIGTVCRQAVENGYFVTISSPDKDFAQLVSDNVILENNMSNTILDRSGVFKKFGVRPEQIIDYLALVGDSADNIPGIPKVGPKTALKWLGSYQTIDGIIENIDEISGAVGKNLAENLNNLDLYKKLVTINKNLDIDFHASKFDIEAEDTDKLSTLYSELGFNSWLKSIVNKKKSSTIKNIEIHDAKDILAALIDQDYIAIYANSETTNVALDNISITTKLDFKNVIKLIIQETNCKIIGHNIKNWSLADLLVTNRFYDIQLAQYVLNSQVPNSDLKELASLYQINELDHARQAYELFLKLEIEFQKYPAQKKLFLGLEMPLLSVICAMENNGILLDKELLNILASELTCELDLLTEEAYILAGTEFNLSSPKQLRAILFENLALPVFSKTSKGEPSTSEDDLVSLSNLHPLPDKILKHRQLSKLVSTYCSPLPNMVADDGRIHGQFNQANTTTGRLSSQNPNLQNIPTRSIQGQKIRNAFIADKGKVLLSADYSQIELRIMAHLSQDEALITAFENGHDVHSHTASILFNCCINDVNSDQRRKAKAINFGLIYGMSAFGLSKQIRCSRDHAKELIDDYFKKYPGVLQYMETTRVFVKKHGYVSTLFGRRIYLPNIKSGKHQMIMAAERAAINGPLQGTSADMIKKAMVDIVPELAGFKAKMLLQVHDELIFEVPIELVNSLSDIVEASMLEVISLGVPLAVNLSFGPSWGELKPLKRSLF